MEETREDKIVDQITAYVNSMSLHPEKFNKAMSNEHRTLQQSFTKLCMQWLEHVASDDYRYDGRNEASHAICEELLKKFNQCNYGINPSRFLPLI